MNEENRIELRITDEKDKVIRSDHIYIKGGDILLCTFPSKLNPAVAQDLGKSIAGALKSELPGAMMLPDFVKLKVLRKRVVKNEKASKE